MEISREFILEQLELQAQHFESIDDQDSADQIRKLINRDNIDKQDDAFIGVNMTVKVDKYDGEIKAGDKPVETIIYKNGEKQCL